MNLIDKLVDYVEIYVQPRLWKKKIRKLFVILLPISFPVWAISILPMSLIYIILSLFVSLIYWSIDLWKR